MERGDIVWHAFPFNSEMEVYDPVLIDGGFELTHALDALYGLPPKVLWLLNGARHGAHIIAANHQSARCAGNDPITDPHTEAQ